MTVIAYNVGESTVYVSDDGTVTVQQGYNLSLNASITNQYGTKAWRDNNPGNMLNTKPYTLTYPGQIGLDTGQSGNAIDPEVIFSTMAAGQAAMVALLQGSNYLGANLTIDHAIAKYSPPDQATGQTTQQTLNYQAAVTGPWA